MKEEQVTPAQKLDVLFDMLVDAVRNKTYAEEERQDREDKGEYDLVYREQMTINNYNAQIRAIKGEINKLIK